MTGDHHGQTASRATLQVTAADEILGTHSIPVHLRDALTGLDNRNINLVITAVLHASGERPQTGDP
jgi:hypothetical protein